MIMRKVKKARQEMTAGEKIIRLVGILFGVAAVACGVLAVLQVFDVINSKVLFLPWGLILLGCENFSSALQTWKRSKGGAIVMLCCGIFVIVCAIVGLIKL